MYANAKLFVKSCICGLIYPLIRCITIIKKRIEDAVNFKHSQKRELWNYSLMAVATLMLLNICD